MVIDATHTNVTSYILALSPPFLYGNNYLKTLCIHHFTLLASPHSIQDVNAPFIPLAQSRENESWIPCISGFYGVLDVFGNPNPLGSTVKLWQDPWFPWESAGQYAFWINHLRQETSFLSSPHLSSRLNGRTRHLISFVRKLGVGEKTEWGLGTDVMNAGMEFRSEVYIDFDWYLLVMVLIIGFF